MNNKVIGMNEIPIKGPTVCIVHFKYDEDFVSHGRRLVHYQVTLDPKNKIHKDFIRFGDIEGDEIHGWQPRSDIVIDEVLAELAEDEVPYRQQIHIPMAEKPEVEPEEKCQTA